MDTHLNSNTAKAHPGKLKCTVAGEVVNEKQFRLRTSKVDFSCFDLTCSSSAALLMVQIKDVLQMVHCGK